MSSSAAKRKKDPDDDDTLGGLSKNKRTRVSFSCGECHRRKQKCDRQTPCSHCRARKVPELCKPYTPGKAEQDISARLLRVERILEAALPQYCNAGTPTSPYTHQNGSGRHSPYNHNEDDSGSQTEDQEPLASAGSFQSGRWYGASASGSVAPASFLEQLQHVVPERELPDTNGTRSSGGAALETEPTAAENLNSLFQECGVSPDKILELIHELPPQQSSDILIDHYFTVINWTRYPLIERDFRDAYASIRAYKTNGTGPSNPANVRFLPLLFVVLAISVRLSPEAISGPPHIRRLLSQRYYWSSRRSLLIAAAVQPDSLDIVLTRLLSARFLTFDRRITECWSQLGAAVRTAQALGMHRDGATMNLDPIQTEYRRRVWAYLYHADRSYALVLGRPYVIQDEFTSTLPPLNIEDPDLLLGSNAGPAPSLSTPTSMTFVILRHTLASLIGKMVHHFQKVRPVSHYSEVIALEEELIRFMKGLPPYFALEPDTSMDKKLPHIPVHRFLLITEIMFVRISLHKPYILRKLGTDRYARSRRASFESALTDFRVRQAFRESVSQEIRDSLGNGYRVFQTAMISAIYLILEPRGLHSEDMHAILDAFMKDHEGIQDMDETTRRELRTIEFLKQKASQVESTAPPVSTKNRNDAPDSPSSDNPAQVLLSLQYSQSKSMLSSAVQSPTMSSATPMPYSPGSTQPNRSPTLHRIHHSNDGHAPSPLASGSPGIEEDGSSAQALFDKLLDGVMPWAGESDFQGWGGSSALLPAGTPMLDGVNNTDWGYWETLVNTIQNPP